MKWLIAVVVVVSLAIGTVLYVRVGWWRMEAACSRDATGDTRPSGVSYDWTWQPVGFTCTFTDGTSQTSLWF